MSHEHHVCTDGGEERSPGAPAPMYCPSCEMMVPENWDPTDERWRCATCGSGLYEDKESYIEVVHATARWQRNRGYGPYEQEADA